MNIKIGTIVTLKSNGLLALANYNFLSLGGNDHFTTPLMVVVEIFKNYTSELDDESGELKSLKKGQNKYKCMYFSNKAMKFEENWFVQNELVIYGDEQQELHEPTETADIIWGKTVRFKTVDEEAKKSKSFNSSENKKVPNPLITFIAPAMQVVGFTSPDKKEQALDPNSGKPKRDYPSKIVKCKFFNTESDKFSEQLVPIECLQYIDNSNLETRLKEISKIIEARNLVIIETSDNKYLGKPNTVHVYSGRYQLSFYNELVKKQALIWLDQITNLQEVDFTNSEYIPGLNDRSGDLTSIKDFMTNNHKNIESQHFKITYCNLKEQRVSRYITVLKMGNELTDIESASNKKYYYLKAFCHLREDSRDFRSDRILSIRTINDKKLNMFLTKQSGHGGKQTSPEVVTE